MTPDSSKDPLEQALARLGDEFDAVETPRYDRWITEELRRSPGQVRQQAEGAFSRRHRRSLTLVGVIAAVLALAIPAAALAGWLQFAGIDIQRDGGEASTQPAPTSYEPGTFGELGEPSTLDDVVVAAPFEIVLPDLGSDESPDEVYLQQVREATVVWLFYRDTPVDSAAAGESLLVTELETPGSATIDKILLGNTQAVSVEVHGELGAYVEGPQAITTDDNGGGANVPPRLSANSLIWQERSVTYRLEGALTQSQMLTIAGSMTG